MTSSKLKLALGIACIATLCASCATPTPVIDSNFGLAVKSAKASQTINPAASRNTDPVNGLGGAPARESIDRYHDSFKAPPPTFEIIVGGGVAAGGGR